LPFEEAKLYGHNATHALLGYLLKQRGREYMAEARDDGGLVRLVHEALIEESGKALCRKHGGVDALFTEEGFRVYAEDLLERMLNPYLRDRVERVTRDPRRKLGWDDRLVGTIRVVLSTGITPRRYALGAAAALATIHPDLLARDGSVAALLMPLWREASATASEQQRVVELIDGGLQQLRSWRASGCAALE